TPVVLSKKRYQIILGAGILLFAYWLFCLPRQLFPAPLSTQLLSTEGELLSARIAADGQWRMPAADSVDTKLKTAVIAYEDRRFYRHWGVSFAGILRALRDNWRAKEVVSGGSTLTMQVARMAQGNRSRTVGQKLVEAIWATRLEARYDKAEVLNLWLTHAPFGGNVVGVEAACRRYYGRSPAALSWAEAATLAVLPNSPSLIHPGRSRAALQKKRDALLDELVRQNKLSKEEADLAKLEPLPDKPRPLPRTADHLLERLRKQHGGGRYRSSLEADLQQRCNELVRRHQSRLAGAEIHNVAAMVTEVASGRVLAYVGNVPDLAPAYAPAVDLITSPRSPGSLLKPILYALAQEEGRLTARQFLPDLPTSFGNFQPANFYQEFDGAVPADEALARSLNLPFVFLLRDYGVPRFHATLRDYGFAQIHEKPEHYGLSLILGGGEITMEEINAWFLGLARQQRYFYERQGHYAPTDFQPATLLDHENRPTLQDLSPEAGAIGAGAGHLTLEALRELTRPDDRGGQRRFQSRRPVAWKTGTSFGFRDAWAVGCTPEYVISVWTGNADGEGRDGLVGIQAAAPLFFQLVRLLEERTTTARNWFEPPWDDMRETNTCTTSGMLAGADCPSTREWLPVLAERAPVCPHHHRIFTDANGQYQVKKNCGPDATTARSWFSLPSRQAYFYRKRHPTYQAKPPFHPDCSAFTAAEPVMQFVYPQKQGTLSPSKNWRGETEGIFFELAHRDPETTVHWHADDQYLTSTRLFHSLTVPLATGRHKITVVDAVGNRYEAWFQVK
ncbi:MAG: penicillin-binding protein 1C, partial [Bacteroidota bacterium]